jgi:hypothetical protein
VRAGTTAAGGVTNSAYLGFAEGNLNVDDNYSAAIASVVTAAQRTLSIENTANPPSILITWPVSAASFQLQVNTNLSLSNGWQSLEFTPLVTNGLNEFSNNLSAPAAFFRLYAP